MVVGLLLMIDRAGLCCHLCWGPSELIAQFHHRNFELHWFSTLLHASLLGVCNNDVITKLAFAVQDAVVLDKLWSYIYVSDWFGCLQSNIDSCFYFVIIPRRGRRLQRRGNFQWQGSWRTDFDTVSRRWAEGTSTLQWSVSFSRLSRRAWTLFTLVRVDVRRWILVTQKSKVWNARWFTWSTWNR